MRFPRMVLVFACAGLAVVPCLGQDAKKKDAATEHGWLTVGGELRGRFEAPTALKFDEGKDDAYYLSRARLSFTVRPTRGVEFFAEVQDSRAPGYDKPAPSSVSQSPDLRQAYTTISPGHGWEVRAGRQSFKFGDGRLVGDSNWGNTGRTFDSVKLSYKRKNLRLDWFAASVVAPYDHRFDRSDTGNMFYGLYSTIDWNEGQSHTEPYAFWKSNQKTQVTGGRTGALDIGTWGVRNTGAITKTAAYEVDLALQTGSAAGATVRAWTGYWWVGYQFSSSKRAPRLVTSYTYASGDSDATDRRVNTFDMLYPSSHSKIGLSDRLGMRNIHDWMGGGEWTLTKKWKVSAKYHTYWIASLQDSLYAYSGSALVRNPRASSRRVGEELDFQADWRVRKDLQLGLGYAHLFHGPFLAESGKKSGSTQPYVMLTYAF